MSFRASAQCVIHPEDVAGDMSDTFKLYTITGPRICTLECAKSGLLEKSRDKLLEQVLGWPEFDVNNKECAIESTRAAAFSLVNHSENPDCALEVRETYAPTWDSKSKFVWYELTLKSLMGLASRVEVTIAYHRAP